MKAFNELIKELEEEIDIPLEIDVKNACTILFDEKIPIQIELDLLKENLFLMSTIAFIPPGKFREKVLLHALKVNSFYPRNGTFGYNESSNELMLFDTLPLDRLLDGKKIANTLAQLFDTSQQWAKAIDTGDLQNLLPEEKKSSNPYNIK